MVVFFRLNCKRIIVGMTAWIILLTDVLWFTCADARCPSSFSDIIFIVIILDLDRGLLKENALIWYAKSYRSESSFISYVVLHESCV